MSSSTLPPRSHPVLDALRALESALDQLDPAQLWSLGDSEVRTARAAMETADARLTAARWATTREIHDRGAALAAGATSTTAWLIGALRQHPSEAAREVRLARALTPAALPATTTALAAGHISPAAATVLADTDHALARFATPTQRAQAEQSLTHHARTLNPHQLAVAALHLRTLLDPEHGTRLERDEQHQIAHRQFRIHRNPDGSAHLGGYLDKEAAALLTTALDPLTKPHPHTTTAAGPRRDHRCHARRQGDALIELARIALRADQLPQQAGQPVQLLVAIHLHDLQQHTHPTTAPTHPATLHDGLPLSVAAARRLACDAQLIPAVLGTNSEVLDLGRATRLITPPLRRALELRDRGCAFPGCTRPARWTQAHHIHHWSNGGPTNLTNLVLLCTTHHHTLHHHGWSVHIHTDGLPTFHPPPWIDPHQQPRRNHRHNPLTHPPGDPPDGATVLRLPVPSPT